MLLPDRLQVREKLDNHIRVWSATPSFLPLAEIISADKEILVDRLIEITAQSESRGDKIRMFLIDYALGRLATGINSGHFTLFMDSETVEIILEDSYGIQPGEESDQILIPHQEKAIKIIVKCFFRKSSTPADELDIACFLHIF